MRQLSKRGVRQALVTGAVLIAYFLIVTSHWFIDSVPVGKAGRLIGLVAFYLFFAVIIAFVYSLFGIYTKDYTESRFVKSSGDFKGSPGPYGDGLKGIGRNVLNDGEE